MPFGNVALSNLLEIQKTSEMAQDAGAILAINGDYYGAQEKGYVIRDGVLYRDTAKTDQQDLVIYEDGTMKIISEDEVTAEELLEEGAKEVLSFGPALITDGEIAVTESDEVGKAMASNPRTAIGMIDDVITSGKALRESMEKIKGICNANVKDMVISVDRMEIGKGGKKSAVQEVEEEFGIKVHSVVTMDDIIKAIEDGVVEGKEHLDAMKKYRETYGV